MKLILAPMATLSHEALRRIIARFGGCDEYYTEMIHASSLIKGGTFESYYVLSGPEPDKIVWQLTDSKPDALVRAASYVSSLGGCGIDINMGCCAPDIYKTGAGIAWMIKDRNQTREMMKSVHDAAPNCRLSAKIRLGTEDFTHESLFSFCDMLIECGVTQIVLHPRTMKEKLRRSARWEFVQKLAVYMHETYGNHITVVGSGDIDSVQQAKRVMELCPDCGGIMIGRGAVTSPWLFSEIRAALGGGSDKVPAAANHVLRGPDEAPAANQARDAEAVPLANDAPLCTDQTPAAGSCADSAGRIHTIDLLDTASRFIEDLRVYQPEAFYKTRSQRFFFYFCDNFTFAHHIKTKLINAVQQAADIDKLIPLLTEYLENSPEERYLQKELII